MKIRKIDIIWGGRICALSATFLLAVSAEAGLKYWTSGGYDADSYVQDGLVLNYDGIRNVGIDQPHSMTTTKWVNLGSAGSAYDVERQDTNATGAWTENAFKAAAKSYFRTKSDFVFPVTRTMQACFIPTANTHAYIFSPVGDGDLWQRGSFQLPGTGKLNFNAHYYKYEDSNAGIPWSAAARPETACANSTSNTATAFLTPDYATITLGTTRPTSGNRSSGYVSLAGGQRSVTQFSAKANIMGNNGTTQLFNGTLFAFRFYNRILDNNELVWNRAVDDYRYFGKMFYTIPLTNAVVTSTFPAVSGDQPGGVYAVDADGYTFTAPSSTNVNGRAYTCTGYTLETWDNTTGTWGVAVAHNDEFSCAVTETSCVRITWQWTAGDGIVTYDVCDYVQDGLVLNYDGIRNVGTDLAHSDATEKWVNLANPGTHDLDVYRKTAGAALTWKDDGYLFGNGIVFRELDSGLVIPGKSTTQTLIDARNIDHAALAYVWFPSKPSDNVDRWNIWSGSVRKNGDKKFYYNTHTYTTGRPGLKVGYDTIGYTYITALANETYASCFTSVEEPPASEESTATTSAESRRYAAQSGKTILDTTIVDWSLGGGTAGGDPLTGKIKNFRFYNRVLTAAELRQNRMVDDARYFNAPPVTNVVIATGRLGFLGNEALGNYQISGTYTFSAPTEKRTDARGFEYALDGYTLETWDDTIQGWGAPVAHTGSSYTWTDGDSPAKVRVTWQWKATKACLSVKTYDVHDYVADGLILNYDGIRNVGADEDHDDAAVDWVNLAPGGKFNATRVDYTSKTTGGPGSWASDGFVFNDQTTFFPREAFPMSTRVTEQVVLNANAKDQTASDGIGYLFFPVQVTGNTAWQRGGSIALREDDTKQFLEYCAHYYGYADDSTEHWGNWLRPQLHQSEDGFNCCGTAILDGTAAMFFPGTKKLTSGSRYSGYVAVSNAQHTRPIVPFVADTFRIGGTGSQYFTGTLKSFRYYDRVLTEAELLRNREVDNARYFGELAVTNVVEIIGDTETAYKVEGEWTFKAPPTVDDKTVTGYRLEVFENGVWVRMPFRHGTSFTYSEDDEEIGGKTIKLEWAPEPPGMMIIVR